MNTIRMCNCKQFFCGQVNTSDAGTVHYLHQMIQLDILSASSKVYTLTKFYQLFTIFSSRHIIMLSARLLSPVDPSVRHTGGSVKKTVEVEVVASRSRQIARNSDKIYVRFKFAKGILSNTARNR